MMTQKKNPTIQEPRDTVFAAVAEAETRRVRLTIDNIVSEFSTGERFRGQFIAFYGPNYRMVVEGMVNEGILAYSRNARTKELEVGFTPEGQEIYFNSIK